MPVSKAYQEKRTAILEKGMTLLWRKGFNATSVKDIVDEASIPKGSFYHYFNSKEDFVLKALSYYYEMNVGPGLEILKEASIPPRERLINYYRNRMEFMTEKMSCERGCMAGNLASEIAEHSEPLRLALLKQHQTLIQTIASVIEEAQQKGSVSSEMNARDLAEFIEDASKGALTSMKELQSAYPLENHFSMIQKLLFV